MSLENAPTCGNAPGARKSSRRAVIMPAQGVLEDGSTVAVELVDLSYDGCRIQLGGELLPGSNLKLSVLRLGMLEAYVRWSAKGEAGLCFSPAPSDENAQTPRMHVRHSIDAVFSIRRLRQLQYQATVLDLTPIGCKFHSVEQLSASEHVWAKFAGLESIQGVVRWVNGPFGGIRFMRAIHPAVFELLLTRLSA